MSKKHKRERDEGLDSRFADDMISEDVYSTTTVTGMVPTPPLNEGQAEGYRDLMPVPQQIARSAQAADSPEEQQKRSEYTKDKKDRS